VDVRFPFEPEPVTVLVRTVRPTGEWVLRRRTPRGGVARLELILNGVLLMDSADGSSETALAEIGLAACSGRDLRVLVGGLGFGFTLAAALRDPRVRLAEVVELEPALVELLSAPGALGRLPRATLGDPRVRVVVGDVGERLRASAAEWDCLLLDVDNGPESLSTPGNERLYAAEGLAACRRALRAGGTLAIWSSEPAPACLARMRAAFGNAEERIVPAERDGRRLEYRILWSRALPRPFAAPGAKRVG
jgi:spermidine synthase